MAKPKRAAANSAPLSLPLVDAVVERVNQKTVAMLREFEALPPEVASVDAAYPPVAGFFVIPPKSKKRDQAKPHLHQMARDAKDTLEIIDSIKRFQAAGDVQQMTLACMTLGAVTTQLMNRRDEWEALRAKQSPAKARDAKYQAAHERYKEINRMVAHLLASNEKNTVTEARRQASRKLKKKYTTPDGTIPIGYSYSAVMAAQEWARKKS